MLDTVMIVNAIDIDTSNFACYMDADFQPVSMTPTYDDATKVLTITPDAAVTFNSIRAIYYGTIASDFNLCDSNSYQYTLSGNLPNLDSETASFTVTNKGATAGLLPDLDVELSMLTRNIVNVKWTYASGTLTERTVFEVPDDIISPTAGTVGTAGALSNFVTITS